MPSSTKPEKIQRGSLDQTKQQPKIWEFAKDEKWEQKGLSEIFIHCL